METVLPTSSIQTGKPVELGCNISDTYLSSPPAIFTVLKRVPIAILTIIDGRHSTQLDVHLVEGNLQKSIRHEEIEVAHKNSPFRRHIVGRARKPDGVERQTRKKEGYNGGNKRIDLRIKRVGLNETEERLRDGANTKSFTVAGDDK